MKRREKPPNPFAQALASPLLRLRLVKAKKGKGSYKRRPKHSSGRRFFMEGPLKFVCFKGLPFWHLLTKPSIPLMSA